MSSFLLLSYFTSLISDRIRVTERKTHLVLKKVHILQRIADTRGHTWL